MCPPMWAHWRQLANTIEAAVCGGDAVLCQITLTTCYKMLRLLQEFEVQNIQLTMGESKRPQQIAVYKSGGEGGFNKLVPWLYVVTELFECRTEFAVPVKVVPDSPEAVLCQPYTVSAAEMNEQVIAVSFYRHCHTVL